ncbi:MAG: PIG-L family deacetylase [Phycisphaerae bacterium]
MGAHPGDLAVLCAGTLARFAAMGGRIATAAVSDGAAGNPKMPMPRARLAAMRRRHEDSNNVKGHPHSQASCIIS